MHIGKIIDILQISYGLRKETLMCKGRPTLDGPGTGFGSMPITPAMRQAGIIGGMACLGTTDPKAIEEAVCGIAAEVDARKEDARALLTPPAG